jgi:hypothetical protein
MKTIIAVIVTVLLSGCGSMLRTYADFADSQDTCQTKQFSDLTGRRLKPQGYEPAGYCGAGYSTTGVIRNNYGKPLAVITNK